MIFIYLSLIDNTEDKDRFEYIYVHFKRQMLHAAYELLNDTYDAEDVVHSTFVNIAKSIHKFENRSDQEIYSYLMCATRGHAYNLMRKRTNEKRSFHDVKLYFNNIKWNQVESSVDYNLLLDAIRSLSQLYSDVMYLYYVQEFTYKEVADLLGRKTVTVRKQIERGKSLLIAELKKRGYSYE